MGIIAIRTITCSCQDCTTVSSLSWDSKTKEVVNQPRYGIVYNCKYSQILGYQNNCIIMIFKSGTDELNYEHINRTIIDGNMMNMSLIIM